MKFIFATLLLAAVCSGCQPAKSEMLVEKVNAELVKNLLSTADTVLPLVMAASAPGDVYPAFWVKGEMLLFGAKSKTTILWYDEQGNLTGILEYENNQLRDSIAFHPNGQRMFSVIIGKDGLASGPAKFFYPDGRVKEDGRFLNGKKNGVWRSFDPSGRLIGTHEYTRYGKSPE